MMDGRGGPSERQGRNMRKRNDQLVEALQKSGPVFPKSYGLNPVADTIDALRAARAALAKAGAA